MQSSLDSGEYDQIPVAELEHVAAVLEDLRTAVSHPVLRHWIEGWLQHLATEIVADDTECPQAA
ncbi:MAG: hypothetical protein KatS3mg113_0067 [Planctomycetaceae bacterium]|nr:MAG: hypothetical protein KatS3mg113_0067 [Planctomycetaceae bacterium]